LLKAVYLMRVSIADVASRANVSISTVSRVLNRRDLVNEKTRERVESVIRELGYQPNAFARGLMLKKSEIIALVLPDIHGEFYSEIIRGADAEARRYGYNLVITSSNDTNESHSVLETIRSRALVDGLVVMISELTDQVEQALDGVRQPVVVLDGEVTSIQHDTVVIDQEHGATLMMRHLLGAAGVQRVVFLGGQRTNVDTRARVDAYRRAFTERGLPVAEGDIHYLDFHYETAYEFALEHIRDWVGPATCVFAGNDEMAAGVLAAAHAAGLNVPQQLRVVGFDDTRVASLIQPRLTTVHVPMAAMGAKAVELLCERLSDPDLPTQKVSLHPELVVRDSCGSHPRP
jgi:LacI family transcriptional regulator